jgi:hypothetical protein
MQSQTSWHKVHKNLKLQAFGRYSRRRRSCTTLSHTSRFNLLSLVTLEPSRQPALCFTQSHLDERHSSHGRGRPLIRALKFSFSLLSLSSSSFFLCASSAALPAFCFAKQALQKVWLTRQSSTSLMNTVCCHMPAGLFAKLIPPRSRAWRQ